MTSGDEAATYEFGNYRLDAAEQLLFKDGKPVPLSPKALHTLLILVSRAGHVVPKDELMAQVWPDTFVQESNLTQYIFLLRRALGGDDEACIETVPRRGYRFVRPVTRAVRRAAPPESAPAVDEVVIATRTRMQFVSEETTTITGTRSATRVMFGVAAAALLVAGGFGLSRLLPREQPAETRPAHFPTLTRLTSESRAYDPAISPDGKLIAYKVIEGPMETAWLRDVSRNNVVQIGPPTKHLYRALTFSRDGSEIYFKSHRPGVKNGIIFRMPLFGGTPQEIAREVWSDFGVSPDGKEVVFLRPVGEDQVHAAVAARVDGSGERILGRSEKNVNYFTLWDSAPSWSPDGRQLTIAGWMQEKELHRPALFSLSVSDGSLRELATRRWGGIHQVVWLPDGSGMLVAAQHERSSPSQLWFIDAQTLAATRVTNDLNDYGKMKVTADSQQVVIEQQLSFKHIWVVPEGDATRARQLTFGANDDDGYTGMVWTQQGRLVFVSDRTGENEIWSMKPDGTDARQLTTGSGDSNISPRVTRDGRYVVFCSTRSGKTQIWRMDADGRNPLQLTNSAEGSNLPEVSPDGKWVYYTDYTKRRSQLARVSIEGGEHVVFEQSGAFAAPVASPDGTMLAHDYYDEQAGWRNGIMPASGGRTKLLPWHSARGVVRWMPDSRGLVYNDGVGNLWLQPLAAGSAAGEPRQLTRFADSRIATFALSPDGRDYAVVRGDTVSDVVLIRDFKAPAVQTAHRAR